MDSSSRLQAILGQLRVAASAMTPGEWHTVVTVALEQYKPHLKYLPGFKPLKELFSCMMGHGNTYDRRITDPGVVEYSSPEVDGDTKCLWVASISHQTEGENRASRHHGCRFVQKKDLYLTIKGDFVLSDHKYERVVHSGLGYRQHREGIYETAVWWKFTVVEGDSLRPLLVADVGSSILDVLLKYGRESVHQRRQHLRAVEDATRYVWKVRQSIDSPCRII